VEVAIVAVGRAAVDLEAADLAAADLKAAEVAVEGAYPCITIAQILGCTCHSRTTCMAGCLGDGDHLATTVPAATVEKEAVEEKVEATAEKVARATAAERAVVVVARATAYHHHCHVTMITSEAVDPALMHSDDLLVAV